MLSCGIGIASQDQNFGLGGHSSGRVSAVTAEPDNPYAALYNPALIPAQSSGKFAFSTSVVGARHATFSQVLVDSAEYRTERGMKRRQDFRLPDHSATLWAAGFTLPFSLPVALGRRAGVGITVSGPYQKLRSFVSSTPYDFSSLSVSLASAPDER